MKSLSEYFDGELHELVPEEDWEIAVEAIEEGEAREMNFREKRMYHIDDGWPPVAVRLQKIAQLLGGGFYSVQKNVRDEKGEVIKTRYLWQYKGKPIGGVTE